METSSLDSPPTGQPAAWQTQRQLGTARNSRHPAVDVSDCWDLLSVPLLPRPTFCFPCLQVDLSDAVPVWCCYCLLPQVDQSTAVVACPLYSFAVRYCLLLFATATVCYCLHCLPLSAAAATITNAEDILLLSSGTYCCHTLLLPVALSLPPFISRSVYSEEESS